MDLCDLLAQEGLIPQEACEEIRSSAAQAKHTLLSEVLKRAVLTPRELMETVAAQVSVPLAKLDETEVDPDVLRLISQNTALHFRVLPLEFVGEGVNRRVSVALADPLCDPCFVELRKAYGCPAEPSLADADELETVINRHYGQVVTRVIPRQKPVDSASDLRTSGEAKTSEMDDMVRGRIDSDGHLSAIDDDADTDAGSPVVVVDGVPRFVEQITSPSHNINDEASPALRVQALLNLLMAKGLVTHEDYITEVRRLLEEDSDL